MKFQPLTYKLAVYRCLDLWRWLAETGKNKKDYPGWKRIYSPRSYCWACEYNYLFHDNDCSKCILKKLWNNNDNSESCLNIESPYCKWANTIIVKNRKIYAKTIADYCEELYNEILEEEKKNEHRH